MRNELEAEGTQKQQTGQTFGGRFPEFPQFPFEPSGCLLVLRVCSHSPGFLGTNQICNALTPGGKGRLSFLQIVLALVSHDKRRDG